MDVVDIAVAGRACCFVAITGAVEDHRRRRRRHSVWVKSWIMDRPVCGAYNKLFNDLMNTDEMSFRNFVRMDLLAFEELLSRVDFALSKNQTGLRQPIAARERLCVVIRYLATGIIGWLRTASTNLITSHVLNKFAIFPIFTDDVDRTRPLHCGATWNGRVKLRHD